ncbi:DUF3987 domain-containing protein [Xylanibacter rarus]|uniref:DUF3987 domain-containing protein n=1 Tax=Xylanibacter rarus TaxID=1676614 RepID=UPI003AB94CDB
MKTFSPEEWENVPSNTENSNTSNTPSAYSNTSEDTRAKVERVLSLIEQKGIDITNGYDNWLKVGFALTSEFQEAGRGIFHCVSRQNPEYKASDTDKQYNKCLSAHGDGISIATFFQMAKDAGIDISNPKEIQKSSVGTLDIWTYGSDNQISKKPNIQPVEVDSKWILDEESLPHFPAFIYDMLPPFLKEVLGNCISEDDRDMMLMGTLTCISATLHNVVGEYNHDDWHPMLYFFVMADAGMGKGSLKYCREIVAPIHNELREASERLMKEYKESKSESKSGENDTSNVNEAPHRRTLFIPTNSSAASVIQQLDNNGGVGLIFDTECDTLSAILKSEYGDYSTIIRKSYHHEPIDLSRRKDDEYRVIERPMLAICLSGTPGQLYTLTPQAEDGTFSRITCYHMPFKAEFRDVLVESANTNSDSYTLRDRFFQLGKLYKQRRESFFRGGRYRIVIPKEYCKEFNEHFRQMNQEVVDDISHDMQSVVRRLAFTVFRIMMVLTTIRFMDETPNPSTLTPKDGSRILLRCSKDDFDISMAVGDVLIYHTVYCYAHLPQSKVTTNGQGEIITKKSKMEQLLAALPNKFDRETYRAVSMKHGYPVSTTAKWINDYIRQGRLEHSSQNCYRKL